MSPFAVVDSHVHLIDRGRFGYGWATAPALAGDFGIADLARAARPYEIESLVFVEAAVDAPAHREEADWVERLAGENARLKGAVFALPLEQGLAIEPEIARLAGLKTTRGVRRLLQHEPDPAFALRPDFLAALKLLPKYGLTFDICIYHGQLGAALEMARLCPEVSFVLDHIGKPAIRDGLEEPWRARVAALAELPNVACKLSGLTTEADPSSWTLAQLRPYVEWVWRRFGVDRVMYGGDWPVCRLAGDYLQWLTTLDHATADCTQEERRKLFRDNAVRIYRL